MQIIHQSFVPYSSEWKLKKRWNRQVREYERMCWHPSCRSWFISTTDGRDNGIRFCKRVCKEAEMERLSQF